MTPAPTSVDIFQHIRVVIAIVLGLGITRLLNGIARFIQHPAENPVYPVHLGWVATLLLTLIHFWWWEFELIENPRWTFEIYLFVISYAILLFLLCGILFPETLTGYSDYEDYFFSRRKWFFSIFAATIAFDVLDSLIKGPAHFALFATEYEFRVPIYLALCATAAWTSNRAFHMAFVLGGLVYEISWIVRLFNTLV